MMMDFSRAKKVILPYPYDVRFWHKAAYHTGHNERELATADIEAASSAAGVTELKPIDYTAMLEKK